MKNLLALCLCCLCSVALGTPGSVERLPNGVLLKTAGGYERLQVVNDSIIRVTASPLRSGLDSRSIVVPGPLPLKASFKLVQRPGQLELNTNKLNALVDLTSGRVTFRDKNGKVLLAEKDRQIQPAMVQGVSTHNIRQQWKNDPNEALYGLGQQQFGFVNIKGQDLDLWQHNTNIVVPFLVSSQGYGVLWDNLSYSRFGNLQPYTPIPARLLVDEESKLGGPTLTPASGAPYQTANLNVSRRAGFRSPPGMNVYSGLLFAPVTGDYAFNCYSNGAIKVWINGAKVMDHWRQGWLACDDRARVRLIGGRRYELRIEWGGEAASTMVFTWKPPGPANTQDTSLWSEVGDAVDYYFVYGPSLDQVVAGNRILTGKATMAPQWAFGLWQSRQRYETSDQSLNVVKEFRRRKIPFDNIVQDWFYWNADQWGSHQFDPARFPDAAGWIKEVHDLHSQLMISVWGKFYPNTDNAKEMQAHGFLYQPNLAEHVKDWVNFEYTFYDAFNPAARALYWDQIDRNLFQKGIDAWWLDATEPDLAPSPPTLAGQEKYMNPTALGPASKVLNGYALYTSKGIYEGQRKASPNKRVFILTRSGFAGQQRYGTTSWSGDVTSTWSGLRKQIAAGLGFSISGVPYWTTDTGGYTMERKFAAGYNGRNTPDEEDEWRELNARWFEFSTFCPLLRVHGELRPREMWTLGDNTPAFNAELKFDRLRYRLFPYIYSLAGAVRQQGGTFMRPMVMDFPEDRQVRDLADEYMLGHEFLVAPVTEYKARLRSVVLPKDARWYDFWTGRPVSSGAQMAKAPLDSPPVYVRAGSIIPIQPVQQYIGESRSPVITLVVYSGSDGRFTLYQDDGLTNAYEKGAFSEIPITWNEKDRKLTIGNREGAFQGMPDRISFRVIVVGPGHPWGYSEMERGGKIEYAGREIRIWPGGRLRMTTLLSI